MAGQVLARPTQDDLPRVLTGEHSATTPAATEEVDFGELGSGYVDSSDYDMPRAAAPVCPYHPPGRPNTEGESTYNLTDSDIWEINQSKMCMHTWTDHKPLTCKLYHRGLVVRPSVDAIVAAFGERAAGHANEFDWRDLIVNLTDSRKNENPPRVLTEVEFVDKVLTVDFWDWQFDNTPIDKLEPYAAMQNYVQLSKYVWRVSYAPDEFNLFNAHRSNLHMMAEHPM